MTALRGRYPHKRQAREIHYLAHCANPLAGRNAGIRFKDVLDPLMDGLGIGRFPSQRRGIGKAAIPRGGQHCDYRAPAEDVSNPRLLSPMTAPTSARTLTRPEKPLTLRENNNPDPALTSNYEQADRTHDTRISNLKLHLFPHAVTPGLLLSTTGSKNNDDAPSPGTGTSNWRRQVSYDRKSSDHVPDNAMRGHNVTL